MRLEHRLDKYDFEENFDLIIIGGGVNGAGVARDAASRGLKVLLLEKNDFASGCSAHSTRLVHGGLRYLEHLEFSLVYESLQEREILLRNYPHLVSPIGLFIPSYEGNKNRLWKLNLGMFAYDFLSTGKSLENYQRVKQDDLHKLNINIRNDGFEGGVYYFDAQVPFAERLVLENILSAKAAGAICLNHCEVSEIICSQIHSKFHAQGVKFKDLINARRPYTVYGKNIINMSGPWVDLVNSKLKDTGNINLSQKLRKLIGGTKGSHILVKRFLGSPENFGIYNEAQSDKRPFFITPFKVGANEELLLIGTTDMFLEQDEKLDKLQTSEIESQYLIKETNLLFPGANLTRDSVLNTFVGVRPLPAANKKNAGKITRKHFVVNHSKEEVENLYSIVGGKLTTFRSLAKEVVDMFSEQECITASTPTCNSEFPFNQDFYDYIKDKTKEFTRKYDVSANTALHILILYGSSASKVLDFCIENPLLKNPIHEDYPDIEAQIVYAIRTEEAYTVEDILMRRISIGLCTNDFAKDTIKTIKYHLDEEFELENRHRDKIFAEVLVGDYSY